MDMESARTAPLWWDAVDARPTRPPLGGDRQADVAIVGAGFTGLWCAYYLTRLDPSLDIVVLERDFVGFGASGRNGGWCHAEYPLGTEQLAADHGREAALAHMRALFASVDDVGRVLEEEGIDADYHKGGVFTAARSELQMAYARKEVDEALAFGLDDDDVRLLGSDEAREMLNATGVLGGMWHAHGAAVHPARLVHGLARVVEASGVTIHEGTEVTGVGRNVARSKHGDVRAPMVVIAMEGYRSRLPGERRTMVPLYSLMVATEPLSDVIWQQIGLHQRQTFSDFRNLIIYGQRTADGRLAFGGRGAYHWGSSIEPSHDISDTIHTGLMHELLRLFPVLSNFDITHRWGGALGVSRDWRPSVTLDRGKGIGWAGGYAGDGVNIAHLAGRTLAELITNTETERTTLPWINHAWPKWEPEPLRWIGINAGIALARSADRTEARTGRHSRKADLGAWLRGKSRTKR